MPWPSLWSSKPKQDDTSTASIEDHTQALKAQAQETAEAIHENVAHTADSFKQVSSNSFLNALGQPSTLLATAVLTTSILTLFAIQRRFLRRHPTATSLPESFLLPSTRRFNKSLFGRVTSVGDADNFRLYHTPLGRLAFWGIFRKIPDTTKELKNQTVHIRLAGIDAPELAHFGRPAQPYSKEALDWLTSYLKGRRVRCYVHKADQYSRVVATVYIRKGLLRRDVSLQMLKAGLATMYESKSGAEFSGLGVEERYRAAEEQAKRRKIGMWEREGLESPREYKNRYKDAG